MIMIAQSLQIAPVMIDNFFNSQYYFFISPIVVVLYLLVFLKLYSSISLSNLPKDPIHLCCMYCLHIIL